MAQRAEIFTQQNIDGLFFNNPFILLFQKTDWMEYLELIARIYDLLENEGSRVECSRMEVLIENFYAGKPLPYVIQKKASFISMAITELAVLKDSHNSSGTRYIETTREGKTLLKICEGLIQNRKKFTGTGADTLMGALNNLLLTHKRMTLEDAVTHHREKIREYKKDIEKMQIDGVHCGELLTQGFSGEELITQAEEAASHILTAGEDIKLAIEQARKNLIRRYRNQDFSVGQAIEYIADFYEELRSSPEHRSYAKAKDILSYLEGIGERFKYKDIPRILHLIGEKGIIDKDSLKQCGLTDFPRHFQNIVRGIEEKVQEQINLLRVQVHYVLAGDSKRTQAELKELMAQFIDQHGHMAEFFTQYPYVVESNMDISIGALKPHSLEIDSELHLEKVSLNQITDDEMRILSELLRKAEEVTISRVIDRLKEHLSRLGEIILSKYSIKHGIVEYYVLSHVEYFSDSINSETMEQSDLKISTKGKEFILRGAENKRLFFA